jgi:hypothetical protein
MRNSLSTTLNILLFPISLFKRLTEKKLTLFLGILLVGLVDLGFPIALNFSRYFWGKPLSALVLNILLLLVFVAAIGLIDVLFFAVPINDVCKFFKKGAEGIPKSGFPVRVMKVYALSHVLITLVNALVYSLILNTSVTSYLWIAGSMSIYLYVIMPLWFTAVISRGLNAVFNLEGITKYIIFILVFIWTFLMGYALGFISDLALRLFL